MGDRFFQPRHGNLDLLLRRRTEMPAWSLPGIGHNGGPPLDLSGRAWAWRRAVAKAWAAPPREVMLRRLRRAEALGLSYRDFTAALMDTGTGLAVALLPLHHAVALEWRRDGGLALGEEGSVAERIRRFEGRLFLVIDEAATGAIDAASRRRLAAMLQARFDGQAEALLVLPFRIAETARARGARLQRLLTSKGLRRKECFWLGQSQAELLLAEQAGLGFFKPLAGWFACPL